MTSLSTAALEASPDPRLSSPKLINLSQALIAPLLQHLIQANLLFAWCQYLVDSAVQQLHGWEQPDLRHLYWWLDTESESTVNEWMKQGCRRQAVNWHLAVATAYFSAANSWYGAELEDRYVANRHNYEVAHCRLIDCGSNRGLALELNLALEASPLEHEAIVAPFLNQVHLTREVISLSDISSGIPQLLAGSPPGAWLPPFHNGLSWILLQVEHHERPSLQETAPRLLREAILSWRQQRTQELSAHWMQQFTATKVDPSLDD